MYVINLENRLRIIPKKGKIGLRGHWYTTCMAQGTGDDNGITKYGFVASANIGSMPPHHTDGNLLVEVSWQSNGLFIVRYNNGVQITDIEEIKIEGETGSRAILTEWNETTSQYEGTDVDIATQLIDDFVDGGELCFGLVSDLPELFIHYLFSDIVYEE